MLKTISLSCLGISLNATSAKSERINDLTISEEAKNLVRTILTPTLSGTTPVAIEKQSWFEGLQANWDTWKKKEKIEKENLLAEHQYQQDLAVYSDLLKKAKSANKTAKKSLVRPTLIITPAPDIDESLVVPCDGRFQSVAYECFGLNRYLWSKKLNGVEYIYPTQKLLDLLK